MPASDNETETKRECSVVIPDDWQLTSQQQAFIELFAEDDQPKQYYHHSYYPFLMN
ncbi:protein, C-ter fragment, truncated protein [Escherichia coli]|uniref:Protein, C-ter, truncated protein n=1 Tax=Escherichia coli TaxID=562 RepID=A0A2X1MVD1_ECOLX|nr:protein, C-ter fragment, truncated protein [Escherichia coli]